jgi:hypothetical protein
MITRALDLVRAAAEPRQSLNLLEVANSAYQGHKFKAHTYNYDGHAAPGITYDPQKPFQFGIAIPPNGPVWLFCCDSRDPILLKRTDLTKENIRIWVLAIVELWKSERDLQEKIYEDKKDFFKALKPVAEDLAAVEKFEERLWFNGSDYKLD